MDLSRWYNLRKQAQGNVRPVARAVQIERSTIPVMVEDDEGEFEAVVPVPDAIGSGVRAGAVAEEALEHADGAAADALQAAIDAAAAQSKAQEALDAALLAVVSSVIEYAVGVSDTVPPTVGWSTDNPEPGEGEFVWMRTVVSYADESTATSTPVLMSRGGGEAVKIESITTFYAITPEASPVIPDLPTTIDPSPSVWGQHTPNYISGFLLLYIERIVYTDGSFSYTDVSANTEWSAAGKALAEAGATRFLAEGLYQVIPSESEPTTSPTGALKQGDQWWKIGTGATDGKFVGVAVWDGTQWQDRQLVADSVLVPGSVGPVLIEDGAVTASKIAGDAIDGMTVTGATVRTAASGQRIQLDEAGLRAFNSAGSVVSTLRSDSSGMRFDGSTHAPSYVGIHATSHSDGYAGNGVSFDAGEQNDIAAASAHIGTIRQSDGFVRSTLSLGVDYDNGDKWMGASLQVQATSGSAPSAAVFRSQNSDLLIAAGFGNEQKITLDSRTEPAGNMVVDPEDLDGWDAVEGTIAWVWGESRQYVKTGSGWVPWYDGANDTDWATIPLATGWVVQQGQTPRWRIKGGWLQVSGRVGRSGGAVIGTSFANWTNGIPELVPHIGNIVEMPKSTPGAGVESTGLLRVMDNGRMQCAANGVAFFPNVEFLL